MTPDVTSLPPLPLLPDAPRLPATEALAGGPAAAPVLGAGSPDFAGLLGALAAPPPAAPDVVPGVAPESALPQPPILRAEASAANALVGWPTGKNLPEPGALLPPSLPSAVSDAAAPIPAAPPVAAAPTPRPGLVTVPRAPVAGDGTSAEEAPALPDAPLPEPGDLGAIRSLAPAAPELAALPDAASVNAGLLAAAQGEPADPAEVPAAAPDFAIAPQPFAAGLPFAPVLPGDAVTAAPAPPAPPANAPAAAAALPVPVALRAPAIRLSPAAPSPAGEQTETAAIPASPLANTLARDAGVEAARAAPAPALSAEPALASASGAGALPDTADLANSAPAPSASTPSASLAPAQSPLAATPLPDRPADPRGAAPTAPAAPQIESAIAQVGDIREALRNARPAMTLQHAEFGAVSLRLEPAAPDQWRAVLASRDPGFVPAIHAALADRAVAAAAETSASFSGHSGASQNGAGDQRYGSSPNGGQGSPQPYLGQSGQRDGEAAPDHRRPSTAAALAARGGSEADDPAALARDTGGLFA